MTDKKVTRLRRARKARLKMHELEASGKPIEPEDKRRLADLHVKVIGSRIIKDLLKAQADYLELMTLVSQHIEEAALGLTEESPS